MIFKYGKRFRFAPSYYKGTPHLPDLNILIILNIWFFLVLYCVYGNFQVIAQVMKYYQAGDIKHTGGFTNTYHISAKYTRKIIVFKNQKVHKLNS